MTRLNTSDISTISSRLKQYDAELLAKTGMSLRGIACYCCGITEASLTNRAASATLAVVPITAGEGIITGFSDTVCAILLHLGFMATVMSDTDTTGFSKAIENGAYGIFMSDDHRFIAYNTQKRMIVDNAKATGRAFATALDLMAEGSIQGKDVVVLGFGPVGKAAAQKLLELQANVSVFDSAPEKAGVLKNSTAPRGESITILNSRDALKSYRYILDATPATDALLDEYLTEKTFVSAPGVPLGLSASAAHSLSKHLIHDKLELGVATMAVTLFAKD